MELVRTTLAFLVMRNSFVIIEMCEQFIHPLCWMLTIYGIEKIGGGGRNQNYLIILGVFALEFHSLKRYFVFE